MKKLQFLTSLSLFLVGFLVFSNLQAQNQSTSTLYFPPVGQEIWEKMPVNQTGWDQGKLGEFLAWMENTNTRALIILKDGKIVVEEYRGNRLTGLGPMNEGSLWYWASAGKTLTATLMGIAEEEKLLKRKDRTEKYLGKGWTSMNPKEEKAIRLIHHLTMTTGLNDRGIDLDDTDPSSLTFLAKPGTRWSYHNAPYILLKNVLEAASGQPFESYFKEKIGDPIGMGGFWQRTGKNHIFYSNARSMARFGLLLLAQGQWEGKQIVNNDFIQEMTSSSQGLNPSYGFLTWLNGKSSFKLPAVQREFEGSLVPSAPSDMYQAMGRNGQFLMVVPSENLVIVRMGAHSDTSLIPYRLIRDMWDRFAPVIQ
ncbi:class C beta-lactamase-related serine hydrolase [Algoriphagus kandeliae]|uniref:Class C beta-lactamase-related serine hydrolase n=1 Tax=Algoriphagus kandeliae TaxID=2562278 RepID=A0A4Y9QNY8_9BACT|nr:serine hydrolase [Algoriphagus kandeliae]TFV94354.1 class C beta-lactamase-related serine hydrolase [Algoriphagus kandeliae]